MLRFIDQNGLEVVLMFLQNMNTDVRQSQLHFTLIGCIKALMNNPVWTQLSSHSHTSLSPLHNCHLIHTLLSHPYTTVISFTHFSLTPTQLSSHSHTSLSPLSTPTPPPFSPYFLSFCLPFTSSRSFISSLLIPILLVQ